MQDVAQYRQEIIELLLQAKDKNGNPRLSERAAKSLCEELSDQELIDGMDFNTPEDVAEILLDSGMED